MQKGSLSNPVPCLKTLKENFYFELFRSNGSFYFLPCNLNLNILLLSLNITICYIIPTLSDFTIGNSGAGVQSTGKKQKCGVTIDTCETYISEQYFTTNVYGHKFW